VSEIVPEGSIYAEPAASVKDLGYTIVYVDTNIGVLEALRWRGRRSSTRSGTVAGRADYLIIDIHEEVSSGRLVVSVVAQTVVVSRALQDFRPFTIRATDRPSGTVRQDAAALLQSLGCEQVESELHRTGVYGPRADVWCSDNPDA
jgi:hypothetical protein